MDRASEERIALAESSQPASPRAVNEKITAWLLRLIARKDGDVSQVIGHRGAAMLERFIQHELGALSDGELRRMSSHAVVVLANLHSRTAGRQPFREKDWRLLLFCLANSKTLGEAVRRASDVFEVADGRMGAMRLLQRGASVQIVISGARGDDEELTLAVMVNTLVLYHEMFGWLVARPLGAECHLDFPERCRTLFDESLLPFRVILDARVPGLRMPASLLELPVVRSVADGERHMANSLFAYTEHSEPHEIAEHARQLVRSSLRENGRLLSLDALSQALGLGRMTLRRRLGSAGTSYHEIRNAVRHDFAVELVTWTEHPIEEIAVRLDFCDSDAFRSAFKARTGESPTDFRKRARASSRVGG